MQEFQEQQFKIIPLVDMLNLLLQKLLMKMPTQVHYLLLQLVMMVLQLVLVAFVLNFTLQFVEQAQRDNVIQAIYDGLRPGGIMVLSEKVVFEDPHLNALNIDASQAQKVGEMSVADAAAGGNPIAFSAEQYRDLFTRAVSGSL